MSIHIRDGAKFAKTVFMPGDPLRAKWIAETFLADYELVSDVRGMLAFTGHTKEGKEVSVMASGMGCPSIGIYSYELFNFYGVEQIIRVGTCGGYQDNIHVGDIIIASSASSNSSYGEYYEEHGLYLAPCSDFELMLKAYNAAHEKNIPCHVGPVFSSDIFYNPREDFYKIPQSIGILAVEMESYALFINAMKARKKALCILTVSDSFVTHEKDMTPEERQTQLSRMIELALSIA